MTWWTSKSNIIHPKIKHKFVVVFGSNFFIPSVKSIGKPKIEFETKEYTLINHKFNYPGNGKWQPIDIKFVDMNGMGDPSETFDTSAFLWQILNNTGYAYPYLDGSSQYSINPYYNNVESGSISNSGGHHIATTPTFRDDLRTQNVVERTSFRTITTPEKSSTIANSFGGGLSGIIDYRDAHYSNQRISIYQLAPNDDLIELNSGIQDSKNGGEIKGAFISECWHLVNPIVKTIEWGDLAYDSDELVEYSLNIVYDWAIYDRDAIGKRFDVDVEPFGSFMKKFGQAKTAIDQELEAQLQTNLREAMPNMNTTELDRLAEKLNSDTPQDLNNDGIISLEEAALWNKDNAALRETLAFEAEMRRDMIEEAEERTFLKEKIEFEAGIERRRIENEQRKKQMMEDFDPEKTGIEFPETLDETLNRLSQEDLGDEFQEQADYLRAEQHLKDIEEKEALEQSTQTLIDIQEAKARAESGVLQESAREQRRARAQKESDDTLERFVTDTLEEATGEYLEKRDQQIYERDPNMSEEKYQEIVQKIEQGDATLEELQQHLQTTPDIGPKKLDSRTEGTERPLYDLSWPPHNEEQDTSIYQGDENPFSSLGDGTELPEGTGPIRAGRTHKVLSLSDYENEDEK